MWAVSDFAARDPLTCSGHRGYICNLHYHNNLRDWEPTALKCTDGMRSFVVDFCICTRQRSPLKLGNAMRGSTRRCDSVRPIYTCTTFCATKSHYATARVTHCDKIDFSPHRRTAQTARCGLPLQMLQVAWSLMSVCMRPKNRDLSVCLLGTRVTNFLTASRIA